MTDDILASGRATHEQNPQAVSAVPVGIPDALAKLEYLVEHLSEAEGSRDADCGYVTGKHFQMMTMCPDPDRLADAINALPAILAVLRARASGEVEKPYLADRFEWAAPGDRQEDHWLVRFCDKDMREAIFEGPDAEAQAWAAWEQYAPAWNCYVFRLASLGRTDAMLERQAAKAIKARSDETQGGSAPGESAVTNGHSPESAAHE